MRRAGASWTLEGAQAILGLRAFGISSLERWDAALDRLIASYTAHIKPLLPRPGRGARSMADPHPCSPGFALRREGKRG